jgi:hypothetical protein
MGPVALLVPAAAAAAAHLQRWIYPLCSSLAQAQLLLLLLLL